MSNGSNKNDGAGAAAEAGSKPEGAEPSVAAEPQSVAGPRKPKLPKFAKRKTGAGAIVDSEVHVPNEHYDPALKARVAVWVRKRTLDYEAILELLQVELLKLQASATSPIFRPRARSCCSIAVGTTAPWSSPSWASAPTSSTAAS
jgi:hypothetical protein